MRAELIIFVAAAFAAFAGIAGIQAYVRAHHQPRSLVCCTQLHGGKADPAANVQANRPALANTEAMCHDAGGYAEVVGDLYVTCIGGSRVSYGSVGVTVQDR